MCCLLKDPPDPGTVFPVLSGMDVEADEERDDDAIFQHVAANLMPYRNE